MPSVNVSNHGLVPGVQILERERKINEEKIKLAVSHKTHKFLARGRSDTRCKIKKDCLLAIQNLPLNENIRVEKRFITFEDVCLGEGGPSFAGSRPILASFPTPPGFPPRTV